MFRLCYGASNIRQRFSLGFESADSRIALHYRCFGSLFGTTNEIKTNSGVPPKKVRPRASSKEMHRSHFAFKQKNRYRQQYETSRIQKNRKNGFNDRYRTALLKRFALIVGVSRSCCVSSGGQRCGTTDDFDQCFQTPFSLR